MPHEKKLPKREKKEKNDFGEISFTVDGKKRKRRRRVWVTNVSPIEQGDQPRYLMMSRNEIRMLMDELSEHIWSIPNESPRLERLERISRTLIRAYGA